MSCTPDGLPARLHVADLNAVVLEKVCHHCAGRGGHVDRAGQGEACSECDGTGRTLTGNGRTLLDLVQRHLPGATGPR